MLKSYKSAFRAVARLTEQERMLLNQLKRKLEKADSEIIRIGLRLTLEAYLRKEIR